MITHILAVQNPFFGMFDLFILPIYYKLEPLQIDCDSMFEMLPPKIVTVTSKITKLPGLRGSQEDSFLTGKDLERTLKFNSEPFRYLEESDKTATTIVIKPDESISVMTRIPEPQTCEVIKLEHLD